MNKKITPNYKIFKISDHKKRNWNANGVGGCPEGKSIIIDLARTKKTLVWGDQNYYDYDDDGYIEDEGIKTDSVLIELPYKPCIVIRAYKKRDDNYVYENLSYALYFGTRIGAFLYKTSLNNSLFYDCGDWLEDIYSLKYPKTNNEFVKSSIKIMNAFWQSSFNHFYPKWGELNKIKTIAKNPSSIKYLTDTYVFGH